MKRAVCKWREANPVEDEGMVDIVQEQLAPLADGLAQRAQQQYSGGRVQLPAISPLPNTHDSFVS
ncbi:hypothetical protein B0H14DRAFT_3431569 [Mycena olivaceomarginata]|nr:hypothetical protein B0H14DRAFT_3431569 [Mycena olivaceomarginata]